MSPWPFGIFQKDGDGRVTTLLAVVMDYLVSAWRKFPLDRPWKLFRADCSVLDGHTKSVLMTTRNVQLSSLA